MKAMSIGRHGLKSVATMVLSAEADYSRRRETKAGVVRTRTRLRFHLGSSTSERLSMGFALKQSASADKTAVATDFNPWHTALLPLLLLLLTAVPTQAKNIELILDASGSMNAALGAGSRITAAKDAVATVVQGLPADTTLAFRAYGHQSPRAQHDCNDTQLLVPFGPLPNVKDRVVGAARSVKAQGYTPISHVLGLAAKDLGQQAGERVIILVSDGKETCDADPCATARALKENDVSLVVHTIGFAVDSAARLELQCVAEKTGGSYHDADSAEGLAKALGLAAVAPMAKVVSPSKEPGNLKIERADLMGHAVVDAVTNVKVGDISSTISTIKVPAGIYNVSFGQGLWRGVEVKAGKLTVLQPASLEIEGASLSGHELRDSETGKVIAQISSIKRTAAVLPGLYDITFGDAVWPGIKLDGGVKTVLKPGRLTVDGAKFEGHGVFDAAGKRIGSVSNMGSTLPLPPGSYSVEIGGKRVAFTLAEGQTMTLSAR
jgi:von Willebrand factor type A domain